MVSAVIARDTLRFKISDGTIDATAGTGTFDLLIDTPEAGDIVNETDQPCTFDVSEPPLEVSEGNLFATFECPLLWNHDTARTRLATPTARSSSSSARTEAMRAVAHGGRDPFRADSARSGAGPLPGGRAMSLPCQPGGACTKSSQRGI